MRQEKKNDRLYIIEDNTDMSEGYLKHMKGFGAIPKKSRLLAVAFGYDGRLRISNAIGYMRTFRDVKTPDELSAMNDEGGFSLITVYYVIENLDNKELPEFIERIKKMLLPDGKIMVVINLRRGKKALGDLSKECKHQGLKEITTVLWKSEPLNYWDHTDPGKPLTTWQKRFLPLHRRIAKTASILLSPEG